MADDQGKGPTVTIPIIDISMAGDGTQTGRIAAELSAACRNPGFFQIIGHGVPVELRTQLFDKVTQFYAMPSEKKMALERGLSATGGRGYEKLGAEIMIGPELPVGRFLQGPNLWPDENDCPGFRATVQEYFDAVRALSVDMFRLLALSLGLDDRYFDAFVDSRDFGGLEVFHRPTGTWHPVPYVQDAYVVNIGDMLEQWTNGRYMSTLHRVMSPVSDRDRYSVVFFNEGVLDQVIERIPTCLEPGESRLHDAVTVEAHLRQRYADSYGEHKHKHKHKH